jgi:hypothetical protein
MAALGFFKSFIAFFFLSLVVLAGIAKLIPGTRVRGWRLTLALLLAAAAVGYLQGVSAVASYARASVGRLHERPDDDTAMRYLVGDLLPTLRSLGGSPSPEMLAEAQRIADKGPACPAAMANRFLGGSGDVTGACAHK